MIYKHWNDLTEEEEEWEVNYKYSPPTPENRRGHPDYWYPEESAEFIVLDVYNEGILINDKLLREDWEEVEEECFKDMTSKSPQF